MKRILLFAALLSVAACDRLGLNTQSQQIAASCAVSAAALKTLTQANDAGKLTPEQAANILHAVGYITPVCSAPEAPTLDTIRLRAFESAIQFLQSEAAKP